MTPEAIQRKASAPLAGPAAKHHKQTRWPRWRTDRRHWRTWGPAGGPGRERPQTDALAVLVDLSPAPVRIGDGEPVGCAVAASMQGIVLPGTDAKATVKRERVRLSDLQRSNR